MAIILGRSNPDKQPGKKGVFGHMNIILGRSNPDKQPGKKDVFGHMTHHPWLV